MSNVKNIKINDYINLKYRGTVLSCPISRISLNNDDLKTIMTASNAPVHIYALCPKDTTKMVHITKENYELSNEELFPEFYEEELKSLKEEVKEEPIEIENDKSFKEELKNIDEIVEIKTEKSFDGEIEITTEYKEPDENDIQETNNNENNEEIFTGDIEDVIDGTDDNSGIIEIGETDSDVIEVNDNSNKATTTNTNQNYKNKNKKKHK